MPLGLGGLLHLGLVLVLVWTLGRYGAQGLRALGRLIPGEKDDGLWRLAGFLWWGVVLLGASSYLVHAFGLPHEPLATWGRLLVGWLGSRGLTGLAILGVTLLAYRLVPALFGRLPVPEGELTREAVRLRTIRSVGESLLRVLVVVLGSLFFLSNMGLNVTALLAGAGVVGLAISLAAQNLIRDFINGFFILLEDQYGVGDIVRIGEVAGAVERFNLRLTVLRDLEGRLHFIPNSQVVQVTVLTQEWSRAVVDVGVAYKEDVDRVLDIFRDEAQAFHQDPLWQEHFAGPPQVLGVEQLGESSVVIRVLFTTKPAKQWEVAREFRRRIKKRLDREGVEIPFPHRTLYFGGSLGIKKNN